MSKKASWGGVETLMFVGQSWKTDHNGPKATVDTQQLTVQTLIIGEEAHPPSLPSLLSFSQQYLITVLYIFYHYIYLLCLLCLASLECKFQADEDFSVESSVPKTVPSIQ